MLIMAGDYVSPYGHASSVNRGHGNARPRRPAEPEINSVKSVSIGLAAGTPINNGTMKESHPPCPPPLH